MDYILFSNTYRLILINAVKSQIKTVKEHHAQKVAKIALPVQNPVIPVVKQRRIRLSISILKTAKIAITSLLGVLELYSTDILKPEPCCECLDEVRIAMI